MKDLGLNLKYVMNTHVHADHITGRFKVYKILLGMTSFLHNQFQNTTNNCVSLTHCDTVKRHYHAMIANGTLSGSSDRYRKA